MKNIHKSLTLKLLDNIDAVMNVVHSQMPKFVGDCWENLCRNFVGGNETDGILYNKASRWWGKVFTADQPDGEMVELDVVAESFDKKHILIGECKWTNGEVLHVFIIGSLQLRKHFHLLNENKFTLPFSQK